MAITFGVSLSVDDYWDVPEFARRAESLGYGRVTMGEHVMDGNPPRPTLLNFCLLYTSPSPRDRG